MTGAIVMVLIAIGVGAVVVTLGRPVPLGRIVEGGGARNLLVCSPWCAIGPFDASRCDPDRW